MVRKRCHLCNPSSPSIFVTIGVGENIRGSALGAINNFTNQGDTRHEEIAKKGRLETQQGLAAWRGQPASGGGVSEGHPAVGPSSVEGTSGQSNQHETAKSLDMGQSYQTSSPRQSDGTTGTGGPTQYHRQFDTGHEHGVSRDQVSGVGDSRGGSEIYHHRDDAITDLNTQPGGQQQGADKL